MRRDVFGAGSFQGIIIPPRALGKGERVLSAVGMYFLLRAVQAVNGTGPIDGTDELGRESFCLVRFGVYVIWVSIEERCTVCII